MIIIPFEVKHALSLDVRPHEEGIKKHPDYKKWLLINADGVGFSGFCDGQLIGCAGVRTLWPGVGEAWFIAGTAIYKHPKSVFKAVKNYLDKIIKEQEFWRVQANVRVDNSMGVKFIQMLGFKIEGKMGKFNPDGTDAYMLGRTL